MERSLDIVSAVIEKAKLNSTDLLTESQLISYSEQLTEESSKVFEVSKNLLQDLKVGQRLVIRGNEEDSAVICTDSKTYEITEAETSNILLAIPALKLPKEIEETDNRVLKHVQVRKVFQTYYELKPTKPKLKRLRQLLDHRVYSGPEAETEVPAGKLSFEHLLTKVQASETELRQGLEEIHAFPLNGEYRTLDVDYCFRVWSLISGVIDENSWSFDEISQEVVLDSISSIVPVPVIEACLRRFFSPSDVGENRLSLNRDELARFFGEFLFKRSNQYNLTEFLTTWQQSVPEGVKTDLKQLNGIALAKPESRPPIIRFFPEYDLPDDLTERFKLLFSVKAKWTLEEITPFLIKLTFDPKEVNALLTKHARASMVDGVRHYSAKHAN